ncbi:hypothetical protein EV360DRAFT_68154 [Lentinula raphanica]|nr:hypothetical protein EV360DRAFT_68154 [Lentinula raphanica]
MLTLVNMIALFILWSRMTAWESRSGMGMGMGMGMGIRRDDPFRGYQMSGPRSSIGCGYGGWDIAGAGAGVTGSVGSVRTNVRSTSGTEEEEEEEEGWVEVPETCTARG